MKKVLLGVVLAGFAIGCQKIRPGGNSGVLKLNEGVQRYSDDMIKDIEPEARETANTAAPNVSADSAGNAANPAATIKTDSTKSPRPATDTAPRHHL